MAEEIDALISALSDWEPNVRWAAAVSLGMIGDPRAVPALHAALNDRSVYVRVNVAEALGKIGAPAADVLCIALRDRSISVARNAAKALVRIGPPAVELLCNALIGDNVHMRQLAAIALGKIGDARAVVALIQALSDNDDYVRMNCRESLKRFGGRDSLVRSILLNDVVSFDSKAAALNGLRKARCYPDGRRSRRRTSDAHRYCEQMTADADTRICEAAREILRFLAGDALVRPSERAASDLVMAAKDCAAPDNNLLRTVDAPTVSKQQPGKSANDAL